MKNFLAIFLMFLYIFIFTGFNVEAATQKPDSLITKIENDIYGFDYSNDSAQNRISRLEKTVYGKSSNGDINKRINPSIAIISHCKSYVFLYCKHENIITTIESNVSNFTNNLYIIISF